MHGSHLLQPSTTGRGRQCLVQHQPLTPGALPASLQKLLAIYVELMQACMKMKRAGNPWSKRSCLCSVWRDRRDASIFQGMAGQLCKPTPPGQPGGGTALCTSPGLGAGFGGQMVLEGGVRMHL